MTSRINLCYGFRLLGNVLELFTLFLSDDFYRIIVLCKYAQHGVDLFSLSSYCAVISIINISFLAGSTILLLSLYLYSQERDGLMKSTSSRYSCIKVAMHFKFGLHEIIFVLHKRNINL